MGTAVPLAEYHDDGAEFPAPELPSGLADVSLPATAPARLDDDAVELAVRQLVEPWTAGSDGRAEVVAVEGDAAAAAAGAGRAGGPGRRAGGGRRAGLAGVGRCQRWRPRPAAGRRRRALRRAVAGRRVRGRARRLAVPDELGELAGGLRWWWWDAHEPVTGWQLQLAVEDPADGLAWAISARDAA